MSKFVNPETIAKMQSDIKKKAGLNTNNTFKGENNFEKVPTINGKPLLSNINKEDLELENVDNTRDIDKPISDLQQEALNSIVNSISNVDNTNDMEKPVSTAQQAAINLVANSFPNRQAPVTNVEDLATTYPTAASDGTWAAMVTSVGFIYCKNASGNWVSTGLTAFPEDVATKDMLISKVDISFLDGVNMLNKNSVKLGYINETGSVVQALGNQFYHSDFMPVSIGDVLLTNEDAGGTPKIALYNENFQFVSCVNSEDKKITATESGYIRISIFSEDGDFSNIICSKSYIDEKSSEYNPISGYTNKLIAKCSSNFADGVSMLDISKIFPGFINSEGNVSPGYNFYHTHYIEVKNGDVIITNNNAGDTPKIAAYDYSLNKVSVVNSSAKKIAITVDGYVRFSIYSETTDFSGVRIANKFIDGSEFNPVSGYVNKNDFIEKNILFNILSPNNIFAGYLDINDEIQPAAEFFHSGFIPVSNGDTIYINQDVGSVPKIILYDNNYSKVSAVNSSVKQITASVDGFVRFSIFGEGGNPQNITITKNFKPNYHIPYNPIEGYLNTTKKILWLGTSIPEGCEYPIVASANNGAICFNKAVGASGIVLNTGVLGNGRDGKDLTETISEKITRYSESVDAETLEIYKSWSYENLLIPYLSGENKVDIVVIDHGFNDRQWIANEIAGLSEVNYDITSTADRSTFTGAFKFLLNKIYTADPKIKVIIGGYMEKVSSTDKRYGSEIYTMHKKLSDVYGIAYLDVANLLNFTFNHVPSTSDFISDYNTTNGTAYVNEWPDTDGNVTFFQYFNPDSVHPFTDKTGESNKRLNLIYTKLLRDLI